MDRTSIKIKLERITHRHRYERLLNELFGGDVARARGYYKEMLLNFITGREFHNEHEAYDAGSMNSLRTMQNKSRASTWQMSGVVK